MNTHEESLIRCALVGLKLLLVGGDSRPHALASIESKLRLDAVIHCPTRQSDPSSWRFASELHAPRIVLVVCARGLTRTQHASDLRDLCKRGGLPLLDCNHIPHPNALVAAIIKARLTSAVLRRCAQLKPGASLSIGGAA